MADNEVMDEVQPIMSDSTMSTLPEPPPAPGPPPPSLAGLSGPTDAMASNANDGGTWNGNTLTLPPRNADNSFNPDAGRGPDKPAPMWQKIVMGALSGMAGSGGKTFSEGVGGGLRAGLAVQQQQKQDAQQQKQDARQAQLLQFESARAADNHIQALDQHNRAEALTSEEKLDYKVKAAGYSQFLAEHPELGIEPDVTMPDNATDAGAGQATLAQANNGTIPPVATINQPAPKGTAGTVQVMSPTANALQASKGYRNLIDMVNQVKGLPKMTDSQWASTGFSDRKNAYIAAQNFLNPTSMNFTFDKNRPDYIGTQLITKQQQLTNYMNHKDASGNLDADPAVTKILQSGVDFLQKQQAGQQQLETAQATSKKQAELDVENSPANQRAAARGAAMKADAEAKAKQAIDQGDPSAVADQLVAGANPGSLLSARNMSKAFYAQVLNSADQKMWAQRHNGSMEGYVAGKSYNMAGAAQQFKYVEEFNNPNSKTQTGITSGNTFIEHTGDLFDVVGKYRTTSLPIINSPLNKIRDKFGDSTYSEFVAAINPVRTEYTNALAAGFAPSQADEKAGAELMNDASSPAQIESASKQMAHTILRRMGNANQQYKTHTGVDYPNLITPGAKTVTTRMGGETSKIANTFQSGGSFAGPTQQTNAGKTGAAAGSNWFSQHGGTADKPQGQE